MRAPNLVQLGAPQVEVLELGGLPGGVQHGKGKHEPYQSEKNRGDAGADHVAPLGRARLRAPRFALVGTPAVVRFQRKPANPRPHRSPPSSAYCGTRVLQKRPILLKLANGGLME